MTEPEVAVTLTDTEFTLCELEEFIHRARGIDGMPGDALVSVVPDNAKITTSDGGPIQWTLTASTAFRSKQ